jgi:signal transduction histidine kinase
MPLMKDQSSIEDGFEAFLPQSSDPDLQKDRSIKVDAFRGLLTRSIELGIQSVEFQKGDRILSEGESNDRLYIIMEGQAELLKSDISGKSTQVARLEAGNFLGLISFWTHGKSFSSSQALTDLKCVYMERDRFQNLMDEDREFNRIMQNLIISNLTQRYRRMAIINVEVARLKDELENDRNSLKSTILNLEHTRNRLIHQEKLATMGQLVAGIAHEINNPSSALIKSVDTLRIQILKLFEKGGSLEKQRNERALIQLGLQNPYVGSDTIRERIEQLQDRFPKLKRSLARRLAQLDETGLRLVGRNLKRAHRRGQWEDLDNLISFFEMGIYLKGIHVSVERITGLVKSLKNYGRTDGLELNRIDLLTCIKDTLVVLNNRLKQYHLVLECEPLPEVECHPGEINQVLTNLLVNACDATPQGEEIRVENGHDEESVWVSVSDRGHGIPESLLESVFHTNVTTKNKSGEFGLGLGLSISKDIIHKYGGRIVAENREGGGARFIFYLPISRERA